MARGTETIVTSEPKGRFEWGIIYGTPVPGTCMEIKTSAGLTNGKKTFQAASRASGAKGPICVLVGDSMQGKNSVSKDAAWSGGPKAPGDAFVSGTLGQVYWPTAGDELNMVVNNQSGTADDVAFGGLLGVETVTGQLIKDNSFASAPFQALEAVTDPSADFVLWCQYLGNLA